VRAKWRRFSSARIARSWAFRAKIREKNITISAARVRPR
jgi:hypothetical protein